MRIYENMEATVIGSQSYAKTEITLGNNAVLSQEKESLMRSLSEMEDNVVHLMAECINSQSNSRVNGALYRNRKVLAKLQSNLYLAYAALAALYLLLKLKLVANRSVGNGAAFCCALLKITVLDM